MTAFLESKCPTGPCTRHAICIFCIRKLLLPVHAPIKPDVKYTLMPFDHNTGKQPRVLPIHPDNSNSAELSQGHIQRLGGLAEPIPPILVFLTSPSNLLELGACGIMSVKKECVFRHITSLVELDNVFTQSHELGYVDQVIGGDLQRQIISSCVKSSHTGVPQKVERVERSREIH